MGKILKAPSAVTDMVMTDRGVIPYKQTFWEFLRQCLMKKADTSTLAGVDVAILLRRRLAEADKNSAPTLDLTDNELKFLKNACDACLPTFIPQVAMIVRPFYAALSQEAVQEVGQAT